MISVVIPAYNEELNIAKCLDALVNQSTDRKFEVIVVDNNSTDDTILVAKKFSQKLNLKIIKQKEKGRSPARKTGFKFSRGNFIFSTDADAVVPRDWIDVLLGHFEDEKIVAVTGTCYIDDCDYFTNKLFNIFQPLAMQMYRLVFKTYWLSGFSFVIRSSTYNKSGGFDQKLNAQEDIDLAFKVSKLGKIKFIRDMPVHFSGRRFKKQGLIKGMWPYLSSFWHYYQGKKPEVYLNDVR